MVLASNVTNSSRSVDSARRSRVTRKLAAVAGAAGATIAGDAVANGITYAPTAGVVAAQGIPGFSFTPPTTVTAGTLRPPTSPGSTGWDIDGNGSADFNLAHNTDTAVRAVLVPLAPFNANPNGLLATVASALSLRNVGSAGNVTPTPDTSNSFWNNVGQVMSANGDGVQAEFTTGQIGYVGFRFAFGNTANQYYYGWASLTVDETAAGSGFKIGEAFYQSTPNTAINVGAVPVPEPSSMALLAAGAAGVTAWRARRAKQLAAE